MAKIADVQEVSLSLLKPYERNAKIHGPEQIEKLKDSIREFGFLTPCLIDGDLNIIAGHGRVMAAKELGMETVPCVFIEGLTDAQRRAYILADNRLGELGEWDMNIVTDELTALADEDFDISLTGFDLDLDEPTEVIEDDYDPTPPKEPKAKRGDIYQLGRHRLMCGNSTDPSDVQLLMGGKLADMVFTDPPYNVNYSGRGEINQLGNIENDNMDDNGFDLFCNDFFKNYNTVLRPLSGIYVCHPDSVSAPKIAFEINFAKYFKKSSTIIWVKPSGGMGWQDYRTQHEPILYGWKEGESEGSHRFYGDRTNTTVWEISRDATSNYVHPTQKPVALPSKAIQNSSQEGEVVLDLFGGSGSTLIASEQLNRKCYMMEYDPHYVDVIIDRWEQLTGGRAVLLNA